MLPLNINGNNYSAKVICGNYTAKVTCENYNAKVTCDVAHTFISPGVIFDRGGVYVHRLIRKAKHLAPLSS